MKANTEGQIDCAVIKIRVCFPMLRSSSSLISQTSASSRLVVSSLVLSHTKL